MPPTAHSLRRKVQAITLVAMLKPNRHKLAWPLFIGWALLGQVPGDAPYMDPNLPPERRAVDLVSRMTLEEKVLQMQNSAPAIPRLGVGVFN